MGGLSSIISRFIGLGVQDSDVAPQSFRETEL